MKKSQDEHEAERDEWPRVKPTAYISTAELSSTSWRRWLLHLLGGGPA